jgi:hypothetical protein
MAPLIFLLLALNAWHSASSWSDGESRTLYPAQTDDNNDSTSVTQFTGEGKAWISGDGTLVLEGDAPRFRVLEPLFDNVTITVDALRVSEDEDLAYQGFVIGARSQHYGDPECGANTYYGSVTYDGVARFEKELFHGIGTNAFYPPLDDDPVTVYKDGVPKDIWINLNFTITTTEDSNARLQLAVDGKQVLDYTDNGDWSVDSDDVKCEGFYPNNKIIQSPGFTFIRNDGLGVAKYRNLNITEVPSA